MELEYATASASQDLTRGVHFSSLPNVFGFGKGLEVIYSLAKSCSRSELQTCSVLLFTEPLSAFP